MTDFAASETNICNLALQQMGRPIIIASLSEDSNAARLCARQYPISRDAVLRAYPWNFAQRRDELDAHNDTPAFEFAYMYELPSDYLGNLRLFDNDSERFKIETYVESTASSIRVVLTDVGEPLQVKYTARITDPTLFDPLFIDALAAHVGANIAVALSESQSKAEQLWSVYSAKLREARAVDASEDTADAMPQGNWVSDRFSSGVAPYKDFIP